MKHISGLIALILFFVASLSAQGIGLTAILEIEPRFESDMQLGISVLGVGDINGDGWPDVAVGAYGPKKTFFYFGGPGILDTIADFVLPYVGTTMLKGDLNGDGRPDLILQDGDTIRVFFGRPPAPIAFDTIPGLVLIGEKIDDNYGRSFAVGDLNNDGFDDLVVGAWHYNAKGKVYLYFGKPTLTNVPDFVAVGDTISSTFGITVGIADINGDGIKDLVVAANSSRTDKTLDVWLGKSGFMFEKNNYSQRLNMTQLKKPSMYLFTLADYNVDGIADLSYPDSGRALFHWGGRNCFP